MEQTIYIRENRDGPNLAEGTKWDERRAFAMPRSGDLIRHRQGTSRVFEVYWESPDIVTIFVTAPIDQSEGIIP